MCTAGRWPRLPCPSRSSSDDTILRSLKVGEPAVNVQGKHVSKDVQFEIPDILVQLVVPGVKTPEFDLLTYQYPI